MTPNELAAIRALVAAWEDTDTGCCHCNHPMHGSPCEDREYDDSGICGCNNPEEHPLIRMARTDMPRLAAEVERLQARDVFQRERGDLLEKLVIAANEQTKRAESNLTSMLLTIGGTVEGQPTSRVNFLQRLRQLVAIEAEVARLQEEAPDAR